MDRPRTRVRVTALLLAVALVTGLTGVVPALGATSAIFVPTYPQYTPLFFETPTKVLDDHTGFGVRFGNDVDTVPTSFSGLTDGVYNMKLQLTDTADPTVATVVRGFNWNDVTHEWVQEGSDWADFPTVTVAGGYLPKIWIWGKVGDETISGTFYVHVALRPVAGGDVYYSNIVPTVVVLDTETEGSWIHNGTAPADPTKVSGKRLAVRGADASTLDGDPNNPPDAGDSALISLWELQANLVDDDANGVVDDENYGPAETNLSDYHTGVPVATLVDIYVNRNQTSKGGWLVNDFTTGAADCDIAVGAGDLTPPVAVADLAAVATGPSVGLNWTAATDAGGSELAGYRLYRWRVPAAGLPFTPVKDCIATLAADATSYTDTEVSYGVEYAYELRAFDGATNIGPRSNQADVTSSVPVMTMVHRFYNTLAGTHFYTASEAEKANVMANLSHIFTYEGLSYLVDPWQNAQTLHRFFNTRTGTHFYTASEAEKADVMANLSHIFTYEGPAYRVAPASSAGTPVYRFFNTRGGTHFYTASVTEKNNVIATLSHIYTYEGVGYVLALQETDL